jgi:hypothetical protein
MSDEWPPPGTRPRLPTYELVRDLWTLHGIQSTVTAAIWRNASASSSGSITAAS